MREGRNNECFHMHKRRILIVEDNEINREVLSTILEEEYEIITAENGQEGLELLESEFRHLSLVILDVYMPVCTGFEFLERIKGNALLSSVPVIVATGSDKPEDEAKCLHLGASDFITKPYNPEVVKGRVRSIIKLKESVTTLSVVEYDELTGLYTMSAFYHHVQRVLNENKNTEYDLVVVDLQEFKLVNSIFGEKVGDDILTYVAHSYRDSSPNSLIARQGDKFFVFFPASERLSDEQGMKWLNNLISNAPIQHLNVKMGYYAGVDAACPVSLLCDRVVMAVKSIKDDYSKLIALYDENIQNKRLEEQRLESDFEDAIANEEFHVWYQPKIDVKTEQVVAAEALVRWIPEEGKMISPGAFIPLFEKDGLITPLDKYIFKKVCQFQKKRIDEGKKVVPISINLSRNSIYQNGIIETYQGIIEEIGIDKDLVPIELTESAATGGNEIKALAERFTAEGFLLQMDDFGTGYSSLASLTTMPFEVIKIDKSLIDQIGNVKGDIVLKYMIQIAHEMGMRIVAEGVEEKWQRDFLLENDCDMIQGYYYYPPKKQEIFEEILEK